LDGNQKIQYSVDGEQRWAAGEAKWGGFPTIIALRPDDSVYTVTSGSPVGFNLPRPQVLTIRKQDSNGSGLYSLSIPIEEISSAMELPSVAAVRFAGNRVFVYATNSRSFPGVVFEIEIAENDTPGGPEFLAWPPSQRVAAGQRLTLATTVRGKRPLGLQWRRDGVPLPGQTNETLVITSAQLDHRGRYSVLATNDISCALSNDAEITVVPVEAASWLAPTIITNISGPVLRTNLTLALELRGEFGRYYNIEKSSNLVDWVVAMGDLATEGRIELLIPLSGRAEFYRAYTIP
jgi:hypothetical protein